LFYLHLFLLLFVELTDGFHGELGPLELDEGADLARHFRMFVDERTNVGRNRVARTKNPDLQKYAESFHLSNVIYYRDLFQRQLKYCNMCTFVGAI
jgi:hypothetical protein